VPVLLTEAFITHAIELLNEDDGLAPAAQGWEGDFGVIIERPSGALHVHLRAPVNGRFHPPAFVSREALAQANVPYEARADDATFRALIEGGLDPIAAIVQKRLWVRGNLQPIIARLNHRGLAMRWLETLRSGG
jgi:putative sterol carrier protein